MQFNDYQKMTKSTAKYPEGPLGVYYLGLGLGEAGEIQNKLKKVIRDDHGVMSTETKEAVFKEMGDVLWYIARLADELGYPLSNVAEANLAKLRSRDERGVIAGSGDDR